MLDVAFPGRALPRRVPLNTICTYNSAMNWSQRLHEPFVYAALFFALTAGFGFGANLVLARVFDVPLGGWYPALVQAHGHAQLFGWVGLFIFGVGLTFFPKLRGAKLQGIQGLPLTFGLLVAGIALRSLVQPLAGFVGANLFLRVLFLLSALLELASMLLLVQMLIQTERSAKPLVPQAPAYAVETFIQFAFFFLFLAYLFNFLGAWNTVTQGKNVLASRYDQLVITLIVYGTVVPMTFVFAIRTLPLYLRLVVPSSAIWRTLALVYFVALTLRVLPNVLEIVDDALLLTGRLLEANYLNVLVFDALSVFGALLGNLSILIGIWNLNLLRRRGEQPDRGEYGRFELLVYSAYAWFILGVVFDTLLELPKVNELVSIPQDAARHALLLGFITLLIFGMAVRMLPGFSGKRKLAHPQLVLWLFLLGNAAAVLRIAPLFFADTTWSAPLLALSGIIGWLAVLLLAFILTNTFRQPAPTSPPTTTPSSL